MPRQLKRKKPYIIVFCEGESEQAYIDFLKKEFKDVAAIKRPSSTGLFEEADNKFKKDKSYRDYADVTDEIWFFFDVETKDVQKWDSRLKIIKQLRSLRKKPGIKVRLLMTTGCVEYWFMLHYKMFTPPIQTVAEKERIIAELIEKFLIIKREICILLLKLRTIIRKQSRILKRHFRICFKMDFRVWMIQMSEIAGSAEAA